MRRPLPHAPATAGHLPGTEASGGIDRTWRSSDVGKHDETMFIAYKTVALVGLDHNLVDAGVQSMNTFLPDKTLVPLVAQSDDGAALPAAVRAQPNQEPVKSLSLCDGVGGHVEIDDLKPMPPATRGDVTIVPYYAPLQRHRG